MIRAPGTQPSMAFQGIYAGFVPKKHVDEQIVVHHVTEDTAYRMQLEVERRIRGTNGLVCRCEFERVVVV